MKKIINAMGNLLLGAGLVLLIAVSLAPTQLGFSFHSIISSSMDPALKAGGLIGLKTIDPKTINVDDIICFETEDESVPVCHRVINIIQTSQGTGYQTKGDAVEDMDSWIVSPDRVLGRVVFHLPGIGLLSSLLQTPLGFTLSIVVPAIIIILLEIIKFFSHSRARVRRAQERRKTILTPANTFAQIGLAMIGLIWLTVAGNTQRRPVDSFKEQINTADRQIVERSRIIYNEGKLPLVICTLSDDKSIEMSEYYFYLKPGEQKKVDISGGSPDSIIITRGFLPLLPGHTLYKLFLWSVPLSAPASAAIPIFPFILIGWFLLGGIYSSRADHRERARQMKGRLI